MREKRNTYRVFVGKPGEYRPLGRPTRKWENNMDWIYLAQDRHQCWALMNTMMKLRVP
jgi:hypothetical protein